MKKTTLRFNKIVISMLSFLFVLGFAGVSSAHADSYLGILAGPSFVDHSGGTNFDIGGHIGTSVTPGLGIGLYATHESLSSTPISSSGMTTLAFEANIYPAANDFLYVGGKAGIGFVSSSIFGASGSENDFIWGPAVGFNIPLAGPGLTVGAEGNILFLEAESSVTFVNILGTVTIHF